MCGRTLGLAQGALPGSGGELDHCSSGNAVAAVLDRLIGTGCPIALDARTELSSSVQTDIVLRDRFHISNSRRDIPHVINVSSWQRVERHPPS
jgi:hypothetical protein